MTTLRRLNNAIRDRENFQTANAQAAQSLQDVRDLIPQAETELHHLRGAHVVGYASADDVKKVEKQLSDLNAEAARLVGITESTESGLEYLSAKIAGLESQIRRSERRAIKKEYARFSDAAWKGAAEMSEALNNLYRIRREASKAGHHAIFPHKSLDRSTFLLPCNARLNGDPLAADKTDTELCNYLRQETCRDMDDPTINWTDED